MHSMLAYVAVGGGGGGDLLNLLVELVIGGLIFWLIWYFVNWVGIPQPFLKVVQVLLALIALIFLVNILLGIGGHGYVWGR